MSRTDPWAVPRNSRRAGPPSGEDVRVPGARLLAWAPRVALASAVVAVVAAPLSYLLLLHNRRHGLQVDYLYGDYVAGLLYPVVGAYLLRRRPDNRVGWVFAVTGVNGVNALAGQYAVASLLVHGGSWPLTDLAAWLGAWAWAPELAVPALLPLLFPDGTLASRRWRPVAVTAVVALVWTCVWLAISDHPIDASDQVYNPWVLAPGHGAIVASRVGILVVFACILAALAGLVLRTRRASGVARARLQLLMFSVVVTVVLGVVALLVHGPASEAIWAVAMAAIPVGVVVAVARHGMLDIGVVLNRTIVYALLTAAVVLGYVAVVAALGLVVSKEIGIVAVALVALVVAAARDRVQRAVDRALFGDRRDPAAVLDRLGQSADAARGPIEALDQMVVELRAALRLPLVEVVPDAPGLPVVSTGTEVAGSHSVPITVHGARLGVLRVGNRHRGERLRPEERSVIADTARRAGALLQAATLVAELRESRERIVVAREEERRRLRHDLHDGVGPQLAGLALQLDALGRRLADQPEQAARVAQLRERLADTVVEVRRVVDGLRPPALDDVGLVEAVREQVSAYVAVGAGSVGTGGGVGSPGADPAGGPGTDAAGPLVTVTAGPLPPLPAATEVAAYRIVTESVANAVRHGAPSRCSVTFSAEGGALVVTVTDDGTGIASDAPAGVGLASMAERAAELGGTLTTATGVDGTTVTARLPLTDRADDVTPRTERP